MYDRLGHLGQGAFGSTFAIRYNESEVAALKVYDRSRSSSKAKRVFSEKEVLSLLQGRCNIVKLFETHKDDENLYFVMEAVLGGPLHKHVSQAAAGYFTPQLCLRYTSELLVAVMYMAKMGCIHRDIKAPNCLIGADGHLKLSDFGSSTILYTEDQWDDVLKAGAMRSPKAHTLVGTFHMMSPEMAGQIGHSLQCDWWSVGAMLYELIAGTPAFPKLFAQAPSGSSAVDAPFDPTNYALDFAPSFTDAFRDCLPGASPTECQAFEMATRDLISGMLTVAAGERTSPWTFDGRCRNSAAFVFAGVNWERVLAGTAPAPSTAFDRRLGALHLLGGGEKGDEVTEAENALFSGF